jgi:hypothetical protein
MVEGGDTIMFMIPPIDGDHQPCVGTSVIYTFTVPAMHYGSSIRIHIRTLATEGGKNLNECCTGKPRPYERFVGIAHKAGERLR